MAKQARPNGALTKDINSILNYSRRKLYVQQHSHSKGAHRLPHHEERVYAHVEQKRGKQVASVAVVPHEDLKRDDDRRIEQEDAADEEHGCTLHIQERVQHGQSAARLRQVSYLCRSAISTVQAP
jgi:hypothetical protein